MLALKGQRPDEDTLSRMVGTLRHRGPDDSGYMIDGPCGLGNTRLAVIDLSEAGHQPMHVTVPPGSHPSTSPAGDAWIVYNGEVYNFGDIGTSLVAMQHRFFSRTDTETLLRAYIQFGAKNFIHAFRGMFALAIWDTARQQLILLRDRMGQKPLYYALSQDWLVFGSEIKALLEHPGVPCRLNEEAIPYYLAYGYPPTPQTLFEGVASLPPGHMLRVSLGEGGSDPQIQIEAYWTPPYPATEPDRRTEAEIIEELLTRLREAVRIRMIADVPLGAFLSGGLDSSAVVALMTQEGQRAIRTFSIGFTNEPSFNETSHAHRIATRFVTEHVEFMVRPDTIGLVDELVWHHDQPFGDSSAIPTYLISKLAREHVTVALTGDGGDELFAGYERFQAARLADTYARLPDAAHRAIGSTLELLPQSTAYRGLVRRASRFVQAAHLPLSERYLSWVRYVPASWLTVLVGESGERAVQRHYRAYFSPREAASSHDLAQLLDVNMRTYLPDDLLVKVDRASMAVSLEARSPFLDHHLVQFAAAVPPDFKLRRGTTKYVLRKALHGLLPDGIINRKKHGFGVPVGAWFRGELAPYAQDVLLGKQATKRGLLDMGAVKAMLDEHLSGQSDQGHALWTLLTFELWVRRYFD